MKRFRTVFMGTPEFSVPCLEALAGHVELLCVVTQPDRPRGRGQKLVPSPVKAWAAAHGLEVLQPEKIRSDAAFLHRFRELQPDLAVVVAFGQILPQEILDVPVNGCINVHASLLPRYRGAAPMQRCLIAGEERTGVTTMRMDAGMDTGDMLLRREIPVPADMTFSQLHDALMAEGADLLLETLEQLSEGKLAQEPQNHALATYAPRIERETGRIDWKEPAHKIRNLVRGLDAWPGAYTFLAGKTYKIWSVCPAGEAPECLPGTILQADGEGLFVAAGDGKVQVMEIQAPGGRRMRATDYLRGHGISLPAQFVSSDR